MKVEKKELLRRGIKLIHVELDLAKEEKEKGDYIKYCKGLQRCHCQAELLHNIGLLKLRYYEMLTNIIDAGY